jgi:hypothetical protein
MITTITCFTPGHRMCLSHPDTAFERHAAVTLVLDDEG